MFRLQNDLIADQLIPTGERDVLSMVLAIYDRIIEDPQALVERITWNIAHDYDLEEQDIVKERLISFICGKGVPPLCSFSVTPETLAVGRKDPCFRAKMLLNACTSSPFRPFGTVGSWITVCDMSVLDCLLILP